MDFIDSNKKIFLPLFAVLGVVGAQASFGYAALPTDHRSVPLLWLLAAATVIMIGLALYVASGYFRRSNPPEHVP